MWKSKPSNLGGQKKERGAQNAGKRMEQDVTYLTFQVTKQDLPEEQVLKKEFHLTSAQISRLKFQTPGILVNGQKARVTEGVEPGDWIAVGIPGAGGGKSARLLPWEAPLQILYEDGALLAVGKPAGILVHPSGVHYQDTLSNQVAAHYQREGISCPVRPVGRLDKDTSGIVLFAKNQVAAARLSKGEGKLKKEYLCLAKGIFQEKSGWIRTPIRRCGTKELRMEIHREGKEALTRYQVEEERKGVSLVQVEILTGRTHQIRLHLASIGHPLLGDGLYGDGEEEGFSRSALHAGKVSFRHPIRGERMELSMELPKDFRNFLNQWK